jgi:branched-chain amino acid transport system ATP-binding protein
MGDTVLELSGVRAGYGSVEVLHEVDLSLRRGSVLAVLGSNGAGKSTLLRAVAGLHPLTSGSVLLDGRRVTGWSADRLARHGMCLIPEGRGVFPRLTVRENLWMTTHLGVSRSHAEETAFTRFPRLGERRDQVAGTLSGGEQQMLALARAVITRPKVLMVDELSMGLAPQLVDSLYDSVRQIAADGVSVLVVEQFARAVLGMADRAAIMVSGRVVHQGTPTEVEGHLTSAYLGG